MTVSPDPELRAVDGRVPGRRGQATRQRLLEQTKALLRTESYRDLKVIDIAREAGTSPATFYQYFPDVEAAILVLAEEMAHAGARLAKIVYDGPWKGKAGVGTAARLVDETLLFWEEHRALLRVVDLHTEEGDVRFRQIRVRFLATITEALADVCHGFQDAGKLPPEVDARASAGALVAMLAHVAAHQYGFEFWGIRTRDLKVSMTRSLYWGITGQRP